MNVSTIVAVLSAITASAAAVFAGLNLWLTGRRESAKWAREAMMESFVNFLDASFRSKDSCKTLLRRVRSGTGNLDSESFIATANVATDDMLGYVTRLRMLARPEVIKAARDLVRQNKSYIALACGDLTAVTDDADSAIRRDIEKARDDFVLIAKKEMSLPWS
jgi:hypothetical protein